MRTILSAGAFVAAMGSWAIASATVADVKCAGIITGGADGLNAFGSVDETPRGL
jgi:hypothetical protein